MKNLSGLKLLPDEELVYDQQLFDNSKFNKITKIVKRWSNNFKAVDRKFEVQRSFHEDDKVSSLSLSLPLLVLYDLTLPIGTSNF